jgi:MFS family permease
MGTKHRETAGGFQPLLESRDDPHPSARAARGPMKLPAPYDRLLLPVYVPSLLMATTHEALTILLPLSLLDMGATPAFAALMVGLRGVGVLLFDVPAGMLVARFGDKPVLLGGLSLILVGLVSLALADSVVVVGAAAVALGVGHAAWMLGRQSYLADTCDTHELGRALAGLAGLQRGGALVGPFAGGVLAGAAGFPIAFGMGAVFAVSAAAMVLSFARAVPPHDDPDAGVAGTLQVLRSQRRVLAIVGGSTLTLQLMRASRQLLVPLFGQSVGLDVTTIGLVYSLSTVVDIALFHPSGLIADRWGRKWSAVPSMAFYALGLALLPLASGFYSLLAIAMLLGLANGVGTGVVMIMGADLARASGRRGQFLGLWRLIGDFGLGGAPLLVGSIADAVGLWAASLTVAGLGTVGVAVMVFWVRETLGARRA